MTKHNKFFTEPEGRREGVMCAFGARPGSEGPHVGAVPPSAGIVTLLVPSGLIGSSTPPRRY
jgi:hypothetical protein